MRPLILSAFLSIFIACSPIQQVEIKDDSGQLTESYQIDKKTGQKEGEYRRYSNGRLVEIANYSADTLHGIRTLFSSEGIKEIEEWYDKGTYEGSYQTFYPGGQVKLEGQYINGSMEGEWKKYYESGQLMENVVMHENEENGPFVEYWENGNLKAEGTYLDGDNEHGELKLYDEQGALEKTMQCERGICHTTWKRETEEAL
ncbi:MAG: toxin-antitoxin system YwqK family antitoxin [Saprospiraceae bacterium]|nr:toxin-antitoxin system YwqK family antitoxin [Saprospiraceae bacterium]